MSSSFLHLPAVAHESHPSQSAMAMSEGKNILTGKPRDASSSAAALHMADVWPFGFPLPQMIVVTPMP